MTADAGAQPGELSPGDGSGPRELLAYRSAQGRWVVAAMVMESSVAGIDSTVVAVALPAIGRNLHAGFQALQWTAAFQPGDRTRAIGTWAGFSGVSSAIAPFLGGWLLEAGSWRLIFLINVPVAAATAWMTRRHVPESRDTSASGSADWPGALAGVAALATITYAIIVLPSAGATSPQFAAAALLAVAFSAAFVVTERHRSHPMLPPAIFRPAQFRAANAVTFVVNGALGGFAFVFIPALEIVAGYSPVVAGSALVPVTVVTLLLSGASGQLAQRIGPRPQLVAGCLLCAAASVLAVRIGPMMGSSWKVSRTRRGRCALVIDKAGEIAMEGSAAPSVLHGEVSADWTPDAPVALVLFHGYGANEQDLAPLGPMLAPALPWAALRAPLGVAPGGYAWFPPIALGDRDPARTTDAAWQWIDAHLTPDAKVVAVGFSQGGLMATQLLRTRPERVAATVVLSGFVHAAPQPADEQLAARRPAVFWGRGARDPMIPADAIERTRQWLTAHSTLTERVYPGLAHGIGNQEIGDVRAFLSYRAGGGITC